MPGTVKDRSALEGQSVSTIFQNNAGLITGTFHQILMLDILASSMNLLTDKATDFAIINDLLFPTVQAVEDRINSIPASTLALVLAAGNITGGEDVVVSTGDLIRSQVTSKAQIDFGSGDQFIVTTDGGGFLFEALVLDGANHAATFYTPHGVLSHAATMSVFQNTVRVDVNAPTVNIGVDAATINMGTGGSNATVFNFGDQSSLLDTFNFYGSVMVQHVTDLYVTDKLVRYNVNGAAASGFGSGFEIEENSVVTAYFKTDATRIGFSMKAPTTFESLFDLSGLSANRIHALPNLGGTLLIDSGSYSNPAWITDLAWSKLTGVPTTLAGYGLDDDVANMRLGSFGVGFNKGTNLITTSEFAYLTMPYAGTITGWTIEETSDTPVSSSIVIDVWKDSYTNYPPTVADTIWGTKPSLSSTTKNTASGLSIAFIAGDIFKFKVDSVTGAKNVLLSLFCTKS